MLRSRISRILFVFFVGAITLIDFSLGFSEGWAFWPHLFYWSVKIGGEVLFMLWWVSKLVPITKGLDEIVRQNFVRVALCYLLLDLPFTGFIDGTLAVLLGIDWLTYSDESMRPLIRGSSAGVSEAILFIWMWTYRKLQCELLAELAAATP